MPFDNFSPSSDDEYLSDGFTEVIIANLAKVKDLIVISRTSIMRYKKTDMSLKEIAKEHFSMTPLLRTVTSGFS